MRTTFLGGWESQFVGLGRLTAFTTDHLLRFDAALDDIGLGVVFLQRHRIEVGLKLVLERAGAAESDYTRTHDLRAVADRCREVMERVGERDGWREFWAGQGDLVELMAEVDPAGVAFRFPVDGRARPLPRPPLIDLAALEQAGADLHDGILCLVDDLARREGLRSPAGELEAAAKKLAAAVEAIDGLEETAAAAGRALGVVRSRFGLPEVEPSARDAEARESRDAQMAVARDLRRGLDRSLSLVAGALERAPESFRSKTPAAIKEQPSIQPFSPSSARADLEEMIDWTGRMYAGSFRGLGRALRAVHERSGNWPGIAAEQLHADLGRFLSRLYLNFEAEAAAAPAAGEADYRS